MKLKSNMEFKFIISLMFAVIVAIFAIQNAGSIEVKFFFANFRISQAVVILGSAIVGSIIVLLLGLVKQIKQNKIVKKLTQEIEDIKLENNNLQAKLEELAIGTTEEKEIYEIEDNIVEVEENIQNES